MVRLGWHGLACVKFDSEVENVWNGFIWIWLNWIRLERYDYTGLDICRLNSVGSD